MAKHKAVPVPDYHHTVAEEIEQRQPDEWQETSHAADRRIESMNAAGVNADMVNFSDFDDGDGNNVCHGDLSVQRMVQEGEPYGYPRPFSKD